MFTKLRQKGTDLVKLGALWTSPGRPYYFLNRVVNRWNLLDQHTVELDASSRNTSRQSYLVLDAIRYASSWIPPTPLWWGWATCAAAQGKSNVTNHDTETSYIYQNAIAIVL